MNTTNRGGPRPLSEIPDITQYSESELAAARSWPAIDLYLRLIEQTPKTKSDEIRIQRHHAWLRSALATFHDRTLAENVCRFWSRSADELILKAWKESGCADLGYGLIALGKLGSEELNLSSDVDLVVVRPDTSTAELKALREFHNLLSETTPLGYALRVDFTLRPGGRSSSALPTVNELIHHYGYHGEMWERLAYVRMRFLNAPSELADEVSTFLRKFSYRKHLDFTLLDELKGLRAKIRNEYFESRPGVYHLKLGVGGIRELELFVHALQVLHGGRNPLLQTNSTTKAIEHLQELELLPKAECEFLKSAYWYLRTLENRLQAYEDQQTYTVYLDKNQPALPKGFSEELKKVTAKVTSIADSFFDIEESTLRIPNTPEAQAVWLEELGFSKSSREETWPELLSATALSRRSEADERARLVFLHGFVTRLATTGLDRDLGLSLLLDFVKSVRAKASFFTLLNREPRVRDELAMLFSISPYLGTILTSRPELIDEFILRKKAEPSADFNTLLDELADRRLLAELVAANRFLADRDLTTMTMNLSQNADEICTTLLDRLKADLGESDLGLIALGKWGGRELGLRSDLDFIFVTRNESTPTAQKTAKRFLSRITEPHRGGSIYPVDMRLRPSGHAGPILVSEQNLHKYLLEKAAAWERQAYLRARPLIALDESPAKSATTRGLSPDDINELRSIRSQLYSSSPTNEIFDLKFSQGGLADIEFTTQIALLYRREFSLDPSTRGMIQYLESIDPVWANVGPEIREGYEYLRKVEQLFQLTTSYTESKLNLKSNEFLRLARVMGLSAADLFDQLRSKQKTLLKALNVVRDIDRS